MKLNVKVAFKDNDQTTFMRLLYIKNILTSFPQFGSELWIISSLVVKINTIANKGCAGHCRA